MRWLISCALLFSATLCGAADLTIVEGVVTTAIVDRLPVDIVQIYPSSVERLYCFTEIAGAAAETAVTHVWYFEDREVGRSVLPIRQANWRTWSVRAVRPEWAGNWRVEVLDAGEKLLLKIPFRLTKP